MYSLVFTPKSWSASSPLHMQIPRKRSSSAPVPLSLYTGNDFGFALENVLRQTHLSISHNSFFTQPRIDLLSQMRGHNKLFAVVPDTADNGNYSQTERAARGREPTRCKIHIQRWFKGGGRRALRGGESAARNAGDGAGVAFLHYLPNQSATPQSSQWASTMCTCQIIASNALGADCLWQTATAQRATSRTARSETYWQPFVRPPACDYSNQRRIADLTYGRVHPGSSEERIPYDWLENKKIYIVAPWLISFFFLFFLNQNASPWKYATLPDTLSSCWFSFTVEPHSTAPQGQLKD